MRTFSIIGKICFSFLIICTIYGCAKEDPELELALANIKTLQGIVPIRSQCKKIRDDKGYWNLLESYFQKHSEAKFSHSMCLECADELYGNEDWYSSKSTK